MPDRTCTVPGCLRPHFGRGWCHMHYGRWRRHGDPMTTSYIRGTVTERFWGRVNKDGPIPGYAPHLGRCWIWTSSLDTKGYGNFTVHGKSHRAHRWSYEDTIGPIPDELDLDHLCRVITCVNPSHLDPVTRGDNRRRGVEAMLARRGNTCANGHVWTPENTYVNPVTGYRFCRQCGRDAVRRYNARRCSSSE